MNRLRLFLAIPVPPDVQKSLARKFSSLHLKHLHQHPAQQLHITLHFCGLVDEEEIPALIRQTEETLIGQENFSLLVNHIGYFPQTKHPRVLWYGLSGDVEKLASLADKLSSFHDPAGLPHHAVARKDGPLLAHSVRNDILIPHITIATIDRHAKISERAQIIEKFLKTGFQKPLYFPVNEVILFRSKLTAANPIYSKIATFSLQ